MLIIFSSCFQQTLLTAANLLQLTDVRDACCDYLQTQLDPSNCLGIRDFADIHGCVDLVNYANTYIDQHFAWVICLPVKIYKENELISFSRFHSEIIQYDEFFNLQHDQVAALMKSDRLTVQSEEKVYESVIGWIQFDDAERRKYLPELLEHVRLPLVAQDYLVLRVENEPLIKENLLCKDYIIEALKYHLLKNDAKNTLKSARTIPRQPIGLPKILLVIGGQAPKAIRSVECYDLREEQWYQAAEMPSRRCRWVFSARSLLSDLFDNISLLSISAGLAVLNDKVYAVGGFNGSLRVKTVDLYDPTTDSWSCATSMEARRSTLGKNQLDV